MKQGASPASPRGDCITVVFVPPYLSEHTRLMALECLGKVKEVTMKFVVIGGTGLIGSRLVNNLRAYGHEALAASPKSGVNSVTGDGLADALKDASVVIDVTNSPSHKRT